MYGSIQPNLLLAVGRIPACPVDEYLLGLFVRRFRSRASSPAKNDGSQCKAGTEAPTPRVSKPTMLYSAATAGVQAAGDERRQAAPGPARTAGIDQQNALALLAGAVAGTSESARVIFLPSGLA